MAFAEHFGYKTYTSEECPGLAQQTDQFGPDSSFIKTNCTTLHNCLSLLFTSILTPPIKLNHPKNWYICYGMDFSELHSLSAYYRLLLTYQRLFQMFDVISKQSSLTRTFHIFLDDHSHNFQLQLPKLEWKLSGILEKNFKFQQPQLTDFGNCGSATLGGEQCLAYIFIGFSNRIYKNASQWSKELSKAQLLFSLHFVCTEQFKG